MATLSEWSPYDQYVQGGMVDGRYMNAAYTLIAAGPPRLANISGPSALASALDSGGGDQIAFPVGLAQNISLGHNMQLNRLFEIGSERSYFIPGRTIGQMTLSRIMYHGPSLLRAVYAYYSDTADPVQVKSVFTATVGAAINTHNVKIPPGYKNVFLNLASDLFKQPVGLLVLMKDSNEQTLSANYFESCYVPNHNLATDAMGTVIQESCGIQFERMVPINSSKVGLITGITSGASASA